jgi:hypothetical protein
MLDSAWLSGRLCLFALKVIKFRMYSIKKPLPLINIRRRQRMTDDRGRPPSWVTAMKGQAVDSSKGEQGWAPTARRVLKGRLRGIGSDSLYRPAWRWWVRVSDIAYIILPGDGGYGSAILPKVSTAMGDHFIDVETVTPRTLSVG